jgi:hypothetical protein
MVGLWGALAVLNQSQALALGALLLGLCGLGSAQLAWLRAEVLGRGQRCACCKTIGSSQSTAIGIHIQSGPAVRG